MTTTLERVIGADAIAAVRRPIEDALGLPGTAYTSAEFLQLEQRKYFRRTWVAVAFGAELAEPGSVLPVSVAGLPIFLVRQGNGEVLAFHNACRHRGMMLVAEPRTGLKGIRCPYHAWLYGLDGKLRAATWFDGTPGGNEDGRRSGVTLLPVRCAEWHHWIFVNVDGEAPSIDDYMQPYLDLMNGPDLAALRFANQVEWTFEANWKLSVDNWENYHHPWVHDGVFDRLADDIDRETRKPWSAALQLGAVLTLRRRVESAPRYHFEETGLPRIPFPEGRERITAPSFVLPNLEIAMVWDNISSIIYQPLSPQQTRAKMGFFYVGEAATADEHARGRKVTQDRWLGPSRSMEARDGVRSQDFQVFEAQQVAKHSPVADMTVMSPVWEQNVHYFQNHLLDFLDR